MKKISIFLLATTIAFLYACGGGSSESGTTDGPKPSSMVADEPANDGKGVGEIKSVTLNNPLEEAMVGRGNAIYEMKCSACHKLSDQRVVGPGWKGLTSRRKPEWIMNMVTNVEIMLDADPAAQALLEECLVRMPNQNLSIGDARDVLEFMYSNDAK
ncbi:MAG: cytochrome c [Saprospirales bacterium]|nr:cytochrome c [Saprospirales bacterium]MBK8490143.1 cytochrome c [Saprospirales bacterium]